MSQIYQSEKDCVEGRGLDPRVGKSCILDSHLWIRIDRVWESWNSFFFSWTVSCLKKSQPCSQSCFLVYVCSFQIVINVSYDITLLQIVYHSHSIVVEMSLSYKNITYEILSLSIRGLSDLVVVIKTTTWYWELDV